MTTPPPQLPFPLESGWDYIWTPEHFKRFAPKREKDEVFDTDKRTWCEPSFLSFVQNCFYRRRKPASGWVRVTKDSLPEAGKPIWKRYRGETVPFESGYQNPTNLLQSTATHWRYCEGSYQIPPPPEPEREAWEVAFEAADKEAQAKLVGPTADCWAFTAGERKASFKAGWDAKAKEGK